MLCIHDRDTRLLQGVGNSQYNATSAEFSCHLLSYSPLGVSDPHHKQNLELLGE